ncbi:MAG: hypothetical protein CR982_07710 [Candidatus Cloacimonadota bacterium]|nr:MAG: hypothetical protein CR982_07710 [Candidatus Cloacimonadota bacterium]PIE78259.1 MAG: hypothetical protein CSA15_08830 [Candidatus Delongbacteria bacterium]
MIELVKFLMRRDMEIEIKQALFAFQAQKEKMEAVAKLYPSPEKLKIEETPVEQSRGRDLNLGKSFDVYG